MNTNTTPDWLSLSMGNGELSVVLACVAVLILTVTVVRHLLEGDGGHGDE